MAIGKALSSPDLWQDQPRLTALSRERRILTETVEQLKAVPAQIADMQALLELIIEAEDQTELTTLVCSIDRLHKQLADLELKQLFDGEMDAHPAYLDIQSGSGGTEAQDWAEMLMRMYSRWCEAKGFETAVTAISYGEVAGIKHATLHVKADYAYGWMQLESGVHRLVRKSPFDSGNRRHTSFASVFVSPEISQDFEVILDPSDLRIDTYRSSGAGGQHVNTTDSAVRITHLPTGVVVQCQNDRSQHKNKAHAMKQLQARLYALEMQKREASKQSLNADKADITWGSQIRSYVLDASRIKDLRTGVETANINAVLNGDLDLFMIESLKQKANKKARKSE